MAWHPENLGEGRGKREKLDFSPISCTRLGLLGGGGGSAPFGQLWWPRIQAGTVCISPELACLGTRAAEQLPEKGKADTLRALGVRAGMLKSKLRVACSLLLS